MGSIIFNTGLFIFLALPRVTPLAELAGAIVMAVGLVMMWSRK